MNIKLLTILSVAIALVTGLTFVNLYQKGQRAPSEPVSVAHSRALPTPKSAAPSPDTTSGDADVKASVKIGEPDDVAAQVMIIR